MFAAPLISAMDVSLQWSVSGGVVKAWSGVPIDTIASDLFSEELDKLDGEVEVLHASRRLFESCNAQLRHFLSPAGDGRLTFGLVRTHAFKHNIVQTLPYICIDGMTAVSFHELGAVVTFPTREPARFCHALAAMRSKATGKEEATFERQVLELMGRELPSCILRRKVGHAFEDRDDRTKPRVMRCVLVLDADGSMSLRMDLRRFFVVDSPDPSAVAEVQRAVALIFAAYVV